MSEERETRLLMISPTSNVTPDQLSRTIHAMGERISVKETCYGCLIEGPSDLVRKVRDAARELDPNGIFSKIRAYPLGDPRRCRAHHGTRPGSIHGIFSIRNRTKRKTKQNKGLAS